VKLGWKGLIGLLVSVLLVWWTLRGVDFAEVWQVVREGSMALLAASIAVATTGFLIRAVRWEVLLRPVKRGTSLDHRFGAVSIGFMGNNLLPARMGEFVRAYAFSRMEGISVSAIFGSLVVERFLDGLVLFSFLIIPMMLPGFPGAEEIQGGAVSLVVRGILLAMIGLVIGLGALLLWPERVVRIFERLARFLPGGVGRTAVDALEAFLDALQILRHPRHLLEALAWSFGFWGFHAFSFWFAMAAFGIREGFGAAVFTEAVVGFGVALPSAPGFFGTFHAAANWALSSVYGADPARSLAFAYGFHLGGFVPITLIGLWYARRMGLSFSDMSRSEETVESAVEATHPAAARARAHGRVEVGDTAHGAVRVREGTSAAGVAFSPRVVEIDAPAKVNLFLHVLALEPSGFHGVQTLYQALEWGDRLRLERTEGEGVHLEVHGHSAGPVEENLVHRAARAFLARAGLAGGVRIRLEKRIPPGSGLGGGSSDAASTLTALSSLFGRPLPAGVLSELAVGLGSDVPFFLQDTPLALGWGRGERLLGLPALPVASVIVGLPPVRVATREAYQALDAARSGPGKGTRAGASPPVRGSLDWSEVASLARNDFEEVIPAAHRVVGETREALVRTGPRLTLLSGSGSAVFAVYHGDGDAARALASLEAAHRRTRWVLTRTRGLVARPEVP
jgi:4-diphosphocytidyl-2C-methyl-D-erythritol kinase